VTDFQSSWHIQLPFVFKGLVCLVVCFPALPLKSHVHKSTSVRQLHYFTGLKVLRPLTSCKEDTKLDTGSTEKWKQLGNGSPTTLHRTRFCNTDHSGTLRLASTQASYLGGPRFKRRSGDRTEAFCGYSKVLHTNLRIVRPRPSTSFTIHYSEGLWQRRIVKKQKF
jgi:hypothetical protein